MERGQLRLASCMAHIARIRLYADEIATSDQFVEKESGQLVFDAIMMRMQALGENLKKFLNEHPELAEYGQAHDWDLVIRFRDFVSHHYELLNADIVFDAVKNFLPKLEASIATLLDENQPC